MAKPTTDTVPPYKSNVRPPDQHGTFLWFCLVIVIILFWYALSN